MSCEESRRTSSFFWVLSAILHVKYEADYDAIPTVLLRPRRFEQNSIVKRNIVVLLIGVKARSSFGAVLLIIGIVL
mgnify:CR=1 FL=1